MRRVYYDVTGKAFLNYTYRRNGELVDILHFPSKSKFKSEQDLVFFWLDKILPKDEVLMIISEYAVFKCALLRVKQQLLEGSKLIFTLHNSHYAAPYTKGSAIRNDFKPILNYLDDLKNIVVLTSEQRDDLVEELGCPDTFFVVPHVVEKYNIPEDVVRQPYSITVGSRFETIKQIDQTIIAFSHVLQEIPEAHLNIIGRGTQKANYLKLIRSLGIEASCSIIEFVDDLLFEYAKSDISVFTSSHEGFHLSLCEAMVAGAVPVIFPYKYGPNDFIANGKSGIITKERDVVELADCIVQLLRNRDKLAEMRLESVKLFEKYQVKDVVKAWQEVFSKAI